MEYTYLMQPGSGFALLVSLCAKASLVLAAAMAVNAATKRVSASIRHLLLCAAILGMAILPLSSVVMPRWEALSIPAPAVTEIPTTPVPIGLAASTESTDIAASMSSTPDSQLSLPNSGWWRILLPVIYLLGAGAMASQIALTLLRTRRLQKTAGRSLDTDRRFTQLVSDAANRAQINHPVNVLISPGVSAPMVTGLFRPVILLPEGAVDWPTACLRSVLLHEMAHIKRRDYLTSALVGLSAIWQWFNPLTWMALKRCYIEREKACDDLVLATGVVDIDYATHLLTVSRSAASTGWLMTAALTTEYRTGFEHRVRDILDRSRSRSAVTAGKILLVGLLTALVVVPLASLAGKPEPVQLSAVTADEKQAILATLSNFYDALSDGEDFPAVCSAYLTADYFNRHELTMENRDPREWDAVRKNMTRGMKTAVHRKQTSPVTRIRARVTAIQRVDNKYEISQELNVVTSDSSNQDHYIVNELKYRIEMIRDGGSRKISRFDDGITVMRMDVNNPYGPIFLLWINKADSATTPAGPLVFKVFPAEYRSKGRVYTPISLDK